METIPKADCEKVGFFRKTHGVYGELVLEFDPQFETSIENANLFFIEVDGLLVPFFVLDEGFRFKTYNTAIINFDGVETEKYAKRFVGNSVYLFKRQIETTDEFITSAWVNYYLIDEQLGEIGLIEQVDDYSGNIVFTVNYNGNELLVPFNEDLLIEIDQQKKILIMKLPDGLTEE